jgi:hypothetical protein
MGNFTFNLDSLKSSVGSSVTSFETSLNSKTKDEDLLLSECMCAGLTSTMIDLTGIK